MRNWTYNIKWNKWGENDILVGQHMGMNEFKLISCDNKKWKRKDISEPKVCRIISIVGTSISFSGVSRATELENNARSISCLTITIHWSYSSPCIYLISKHACSTAIANNDNNKIIKNKNIIRPTQVFYVHGNIENEITAT